MYKQREWANICIQKLLFNLLKSTVTIKRVYSRGRSVITKPLTNYFLLTNTVSTVVV